MTTQGDVLRKRLDLLWGQSSKFDTRVATAEECSTKLEEVTSLVKNELPKCLEESAIEAVEILPNRKAFERKTALWSWDGLVATFKDFSKDILYRRQVSLTLFPS